MSQHPLLHGPQPGDRVPGTLIDGVGLELHPLETAVLEGVPQQQELHLRVQPLAPQGGTPSSPRGRAAPEVRDHPGTWFRPPRPPGRNECHRSTGWCTWPGPHPPWRSGGRWPRPGHRPHLRSRARTRADRPVPPPVLPRPQAGWDRVSRAGRSGACCQGCVSRNASLHPCVWIFWGCAAITGSRVAKPH